MVRDPFTVRFEDDAAYLERASRDTPLKLATVGWIEYDGPDDALQDTYLLMERSEGKYGAGRYMGPGGKLDEEDFEGIPDDTGMEYDNPAHSQIARIKTAAYDNLKREVQEEAGIDIYDVQHIGFVRVHEDSTDDAWQIHHYHARTDDTPEQYNHREGQFQWHELDALDETEFAPHHGELSQHIQKRAPFGGWIAGGELNYVLRPTTS